MPIIVRGQEDKGVQVWSFGKIIYQKLLGYFLNEEVGDILHPTEGFDLHVVIKQQPGKQFQDTDVEAARRPRKLSDDAVQAKQWLESVPNIDDMYRLKTPQEIEVLLNNWLSGGDTTSQSDEGTQRGPQHSTSSDELDDIVNDVKGEDAAPQVEPKAGKSPRGKLKNQQTVDVDNVTVVKKTLDDAFDELMANDD
jgi:hypothetical protein